MRPETTPTTNATRMQLAEAVAQLDLVRAELAAIREQREMLRTTLRHVLPLAQIEAKGSFVWSRTVGRIEQAIEVTQ